MVNMWARETLTFSILLTFYSGEFVAGDKLKLCVVETQKNINIIHKSCEKLGEPESPVECTRGNDKFDCLRKIAEEKSDFMVLEAEDLVAAASWAELKVLVTSELRFFANENYQYQVVALMRKSAGIERFSDVKGKRFCHPGYESTNDWTPTLATYFEKTLIEKQCDPNKTLVENQVAAASNFFESACMAGPWTSDAQLDNKLKSRYKNLCALCDNPAGCYSTDKYHGPEGALLCLTDYAGDIAWVRVAQAQSHFNSLGINKDDYSYLCTDGSTRDMQTEEPCSWITRLWPVVIANRKKNNVVSDLMMSATNQSMPWQGALVRLLENYHLSEMIPENYGTPDDYLKRAPGFSSAYIYQSCEPSRTIKWCVLSTVEQRKCLWLSRALSAYGTEPMISCITRPSRIACMEAVKEGQADLFVVTPDEELTARQKGLKRVVHVFTNKQEDLNKVAAVVKSNSKIKNLQQLKGLKACFTEYRSIGWNAFVSIMRKASGSDWDSSDVTAVSNYFKESCVPGLGKEIESMHSNLHSLCKEVDRAADEANALKCLVDGGGDVAFISLSTIKKNTGSQNQPTWAQKLKESDFKPLCFNESNPETCFLTWTTLGSVMVYENISAVRFEEIYSALLQLDQLFGETYKGQTPAFLMYGTYDGSPGIIFPKETERLQSDIGHVRLERNYEEIVDDMISNPPRSDARQLNFNFVELFICITISIVSRMMRSEL